MNEDPPTTRLSDCPSQPMDLRTKASRSYGTRYSIAGLMYVIILFQWFDAGFPFSPGWTLRMSSAFEVLSEKPSEALVFLGVAVGSSVIPLIGVLIYASLLKISSERRHAQIGIAVGILLAVSRIIGAWQHIPSYLQQYQ